MNILRCTLFAVLLALVLGVGCGKKAESPTVEIANPIVEKAIRKELKKPTGELTKADLEKMTKLFLESSKLTSVKSLEKLTQLTYLGLLDNQLTDVKGLEKLTQLKVLFLSHNELTDVKGLEKLTQLKELDLVGNQLTSVKGLEKLAKLTSLNLKDNPNLTEAQIAELEKGLPNCKIYTNPTK